MKTVQLALLTGLMACVVACGYSAKNVNTAPQPGAMPTIATLAPDQMAALSPTFQLAVNGSDFNTDAVVNFGGKAQTTAYVSATQLTIMVPTSAITAPGAVPVTVTNPGKAGTGQYGSGGTLAETSAAVNFTVN
jgi:hypothetical protein